MKTIYLLSITLLFAACNRELTPEEIKDDFKKKAYQYLNHKIDTDKKKEILAVEIVQVDGVYDLTEKKAAYVEMTPILEEARIKLDFWTKMDEVDRQFGVPASQSTINAEKDYRIVMDRALEMDAQAKQKDSTTMIGYHVTMKVDLTKADGSMVRAVPMNFYFDKERFLNALLMESVYGK